MVKLEIERAKQAENSGVTEVIKMEIKIKIKVEELAELINKLQIQPSILEKITDEVANKINLVMSKF